MLIIVSKHTKHPSAHLHMNSPPLAFRDLGLKYLIVGSDCPGHTQITTLNLEPWWPTLPFKSTHCAGQQGSHEPHSVSLVPVGAKDPQTWFCPRKLKAGLGEGHSKSSQRPRHRDGPGKERRPGSDGIRGSMPEPPHVHMSLPWTWLFPKGPHGSQRDPVKSSVPSDSCQLRAPRMAPPPGHTLRPSPMWALLPAPLRQDSPGWQGTLYPQAWPPK